MDWIRDAGRRGDYANLFNQPRYLLRDFARDLGFDWSREPRQLVSDIIEYYRLRDEDEVRTVTGLTPIAEEILEEEWEGVASGDSIEELLQGLHSLLPRVLRELRDDEIIFELDGDIIPVARIMFNPETLDRVLVFEDWVRTRPEYDRLAHFEDPMAMLNLEG